MQTVKNKFKNIKNEHLKTMYKDKNSILSLKQPNNFYRELVSSRFISNFKNIKKPEIYKCSDKRYKLFQNYFNETNKFTKTNVKFGKFAEKLPATQSISNII